MHLAAHNCSGNAADKGATSRRTSVKLAAPARGPPEHPASASLGCELRRQRRPAAWHTTGTLSEQPAGLPGLLGLRRMAHRVAAMVLIARRRRSAEGCRIDDGQGPSLLSGIRCLPLAGA